MAKYNIPSKGTDKIVNYEGAYSYKRTPEMDLYVLACTSLMKDTFYEKSDDRLERLRQLVAKVNPEFTARLSTYVRKEMYLRTLPVILNVELAKVCTNNNSNLVRKAITNTVQRVDDITETLAYYQFANKHSKLHKIDNQLKRGLNEAFTKFDEYQFAKYNRDGKIKLRDAMFLLHPKPLNPEQATIFKKIADDNLGVPYTWEVEFTKLGQQTFEDETAKRNAFRIKWQEMIDSHKMGYMATLRNLRNLLDYNVSTQHIDKVANFLSAPQHVRKSKQLPFRYYSAYKEIQKHPNPQVGVLLEALNKAIIASIENFDFFTPTDTVCIAGDVSGSMYGNNVTRTINATELALILAVLLRRYVKRVTLYLFSTELAICNIPQDVNVFEAVEKLKQQLFSGGTNAYLVLNDMVNRAYSYDKTIFITDEQFWDSHVRDYNWSYQSHDAGFNTQWHNYLAKVNPEAKLYLWNVVGYQHGALQINQRNVFSIAGWSNKVFNMLSAIENGNKVVDVIKNIEL